MSAVSLIRTANIYLVYLEICLTHVTYWNTRSCLRHRATSRKVVSSIPDDVIAFFN
jgi:hypothetical protein